MKKVGSRIAVALAAVAVMIPMFAVPGNTQARPSMELLETKNSATSTTIDVVGQVKNISSRQVSGVTVYCDFQDANGKTIKRETGQLETDPLGPNKISEFKISTPYNAAIKRFNVTFSQMFGGPLVTKDSRKQ